MNEVYYGVEPYSGKIIKHYGLPDGAMKWGYSHGKLVNPELANRVRKNKLKRYSVFNGSDTLHFKDEESFKNYIKMKEAAKKRYKAENKRRYEKEKYHTATDGNVHASR